MTTFLLPGTGAPAAGRARQPITAEPGHPLLDVVVPVHNEQAALERCVRALHAHLTSAVPYPFRITIADNASTDATLAIAQALQAVVPGVVAVHLADKGRGRALAAVWAASNAPVLVYMDVDLSTDLAALLPLVAPLVSGHSDLAIGTRLAPGSQVVRGPQREVISRCYNLLLRRALGARFTDAQCGFKAIRADVAGQLLPLVADTGWFFDTELLVLAERAGLRIAEVPVDWVDDPTSSVDIVRTATEDLQGIWRLGRALSTGTLPVAALRARLGRAPLATAEATAEVTGVPAGMTGQLVRFGVIGAASTLAYLVLYVLLRDPAGAQGANLVALVLTAVANTAANRRLTFGITGSGGVVRSQAQGLLVLAAALALTSGSLAGLHALAVHPGRGLEVTVLVVANAAATALRFLLLRHWVFPRSQRSGVLLQR